MPNHVTNQLTFGSDADSLAVFHRMLEEVRETGKPLGTFDFNKLIPMPESLNIECSAKIDESLKLYQAYVRELAQAGPADEDRVERKWALHRKQNPDV